RGVDFSNLFLPLKGGSYPSLAAAKAAGVPTIAYGAFVNTLINFLIVAFVVFLLVRGVNRLKRQPLAPEPVPTTKQCPLCLAPIPEHGSEVTLPADPTRHGLLPLGPGEATPLDVVFPVLHGTYGEDGTIQGLLELADLPYVGAGVLASAAGMDKAIMKSVFRDAGIPVCRWLVARIGAEEPHALAQRVGTALGYPCFVKPANLGSSVGITKVKEPAGLAAAVAEAGAYDPKLVIEEAIDGREFECAVLGNDAPQASVVGELVPSREFYD